MSAGCNLTRCDRCHRYHCSQHPPPACAAGTGTPAQASGLNDSKEDGVKP